MIKRAHFISTSSTLTAEGAAHLYRDNVWKHHGWPKKITSDRGPQFAVAFARKLNRLLGIKMGLSTAFHPQTDGQTERVNQELEQYLHLYTNYMQDDWNEYLASAEFTFNNRTHSSTGYSPFYLDYGRHPHTPISQEHASSSNPMAEEFMKRLEHSQKVAVEALERAAENMKKYADRARREEPELEIGQDVWLDMRNIKTTRPTKKLDDRRAGPFKVEKKISPVAYRITLPESWRVHPVFHISLLRPANLDESLHPIQDVERPPPDIINQEEEFEVEDILDHRGSLRHRQYLVKWQGYPMSEATWEAKSNLKHAPDIVRAYERSL